MAKRWVVVCKPREGESPHVGPFDSREDAVLWASRNEDIDQGREIIDIRELDMPIGPGD
jgi:hypothetical protein